MKPVFLPLVCRFLAYVFSSRAPFFPLSYRLHLPLLCFCLASTRLAGVPYCPNILCGFIITEQITLFFGLAFCTASSPKFLARSCLVISRDQYQILPDHFSDFLVVPGFIVGLSCLFSTSFSLIILSLSPGLIKTCFRLFMSGYILSCDNGFGSERIISYATIDQTRWNEPFNTLSAPVLIALMLSHLSKQTDHARCAHNNETQ